MHLEFICLAFIVGEIKGYPDFQMDIPNGARIPNPCNRNQNWPGVGHDTIQGAGPRNQFGRDFANNLFKWTKALCQMDSDGDGKTNGQEVGDPDCVWTKGAAPAITDSSLLSHPGVCEPITSPSCSGKVNLLKQIDSCNVMMNTTSSDWCPALRSPDVQTLSLRFDETVMSSEETKYLCQTFEVPFDQQYHIIAWEPIISNPEMMHHMIMFVCDTAEAFQTIERTRNYSRPTECDLEPPECTNNTISWAFGMEKRCYGNEAGMLMGHDVFRKVILQIHYNNPFKKSGSRDSSGLRIYYTARRRPYDIAVLTPGQYDIAIPPQSPETKIIGRSFQSRECSLQRLRGHDSYKIMSMLFHMHTTGVHAKLSIENYMGTKRVIVDDAFSYDRPLRIIWDPANQPVLLPGDNVVIECTYQSTKRTNWTFFGEKMSDEMCMAFLEIYPRPTDANFVEMGAYGLYDYCDESGVSTISDLCPNLVLNKMIRSMADDKQMSLVGMCSNSLTSNSTDCCRYLSQHNMLSYPCVYTAAYNIANGFVGNSHQSNDGVNIVFANIVRCVSALQTITMQDLFGPQGLRGNNNAAVNLHSTSANLLMLVSLLVVTALQHSQI